jgi:hypothetical protein
VRRLVSCAVAIGLIVLGSPTCLCSLLFSRTVERATAASEVRCTTMNMSAPTTQLAGASRPTIAAGSASCCVISQAPLSESRNDASRITLHQDLRSAPQAIIVKIHSSESGFMEVPHVFASPPLRSLLCTFLI